MLKDFSKELLSRLKDLPNVRPFVCEGNPLDCKIFIVGFNPATEMKRLFLEDWDNNLGFNKSAWLDSYIEERSNAPLSPTKKRRNRLSNTRMRIEWITENLMSTRCLETILYSKATKTAKELLPADRNTELFIFLVKSIKPKILFLHGSEVREEIGKIFSLDLHMNSFSHCEIFGNSVTIIPKKHLSRGWSKDNTISFAKELNAYI